MADPEAPRDATPRLLTEPRRPARIRALARWLRGWRWGPCASAHSWASSTRASSRPRCPSCDPTCTHRSPLSSGSCSSTCSSSPAASLRSARSPIGSVASCCTRTASASSSSVRRPARSLRRSACWWLRGFVQALGAVMLQANSYALIRDVLPPSRLGTGLGVQGAAQAVGLSVGPVARRGAHRARRVAAHLPGQRADRADRTRTRMVPPPAEHASRPREPHRSRPEPCCSRRSPPRSWRHCRFAAQPGTPGLGRARARGPRHCLLVAGRVRPPATCRRARSSTPRWSGSLPSSPGIGAALLSYVVLFGCLVAVPFFLETHTARSAPAAAGLELSALPCGARDRRARSAALLRDRFGPRIPTGAGMAVAAGGWRCSRRRIRDPGVTLAGALPSPAPGWGCSSRRTMRRR